MAAKYLGGFKTLMIFFYYIFQKYPRSVNTLDPPRPQDGRIAKQIVPRPPPMKTAAVANAPANPNYVR